MNEFTPDFYTLTDEDGVETTFELLDSFEENDITYYAMTPVLEDENEEEDLTFVVLKGEIDDETGEEIMLTLDDEAEYERIGEFFIARNSVEEE